MICKECKKNINPLTLVNGKWGCPNCKKYIVNYQFKVTKINEEYAKRANIYYHKALVISSHDAKAEWKRYIEMAIKYAKLAQEQANPNGYLLLAYLYDYNYFNDVLKEKLTEVEGVKVASPYYQAIVKTPYEDVTVEIDDEAEYKNSYIKLQEQAANSFSRMLNGLSHDDKTIYGVNEIIRNLEYLRKEYNIPYRNESFSGQLDNIDEINKLFFNKEDKNKEPILGFFKLTVEELEDVFRDVKKVPFNNWLFYVYKITDNDKTRDRILTEGDIPCSIVLKNVKYTEDTVLKKTNNQLANTSQVALVLINKTFKSKYKNANKLLNMIRDTDDQDRKKTDNDICDFYNDYISVNNTNTTNRRSNFILYEDDIIFKSKLEELLKLLVEEE